MNTRSKARKAVTRKPEAHKMNPELQRKIARGVGELQETLINLRFQAHQVHEACDLESGSPVYLVQLLAREAERQVGAIQLLSGDY